MGRPVPSKHLGNTHPHSIKVSAWTAGESAGPAAGFIKTQKSDRNFVCFTANSGPNFANAVLCTLTNGAPTAQGQASLRCFPYGADGSSSGVGATANAWVGLVGGNVYTDIYGVSYGGAGYAVNDKVSFNIGTNNQIGNLTVSAVSGNGAVASFSVANTGVYVTLPISIANVVPSSTTGNGTGLQASLNFGVTNVSVITGGTGYSTGNVQIDFQSTADLDFGVDATATAVIGNAIVGNIASITVNTLGSGYTVVPTVEVINTSNGAVEYVARLSSRRVITWGGNCYRWYPAGDPISNSGTSGNILTQCNLDTL